MVVFERKIKKMGNSLAIILGKEFIEINNLEAGDIITLDFIKKEKAVNNHRGESYLK